MRFLGGLVMSAAGAVAGRKWAKDGALTAVTLGSLYSSAFALSHPLAKRIGAVPAVATVALVTAGAAWLLHDRTADQGSV